MSLIHACRRMVYLHTILRKESTELVSRIYLAQKTDSLPGDYCRLVAADLTKMEINLSESQISCMTSKAYKTHIKSKVTQYAFKYLTNEQQTHSKIKHIQYSKLEIQSYLKSSLFSNDDISTLFGLRSRTIRGIRNDFRELYKPNLSCPLCGQHLDSLPELLSCATLQAGLQNQSESVKMSVSQTRHEDIFSSDILKQKQATDTYTLLLKLREDLLETS